jgi:AraC-like DNA-binding protein
MRAADFVHSYFDAWNHRNSVAVADHLTSDGVYLDVPENTSRSHDELVISLDEFFSEYRHRYELIGDILEGPSTIAFQYRMYTLVQGRKDAEDKPIQGAEFVTLYRDAAMTIYDYYNIPGLDQPSGVIRSMAHIARSARTAKYAKSGLSEQQHAFYKQQLEYIMRVDQAYLRSDLTLPNLAALIDCSVNHLSQVINSGFGMSFFDYVNSYRVKHVQELLRERNGSGNAVLNIAFMAGFNSNSAFYAAFKKYVGQTPAQYRQSRAHHDG